MNDRFMSRSHINMTPSYTWTGKHTTHWAATGLCYSNILAHKESISTGLKMRNRPNSYRIRLILNRRRWVTSSSKDSPWVSGWSHFQLLGSIDARFPEMNSCSKKLSFKQLTQQCPRLNCFLFQKINIYKRLQPTIFGIITIHEVLVCFYCTPQLMNVRTGLQQMAGSEEIIGTHRSYKYMSVFL